MCSNAAVELHYISQNDKEKKMMIADITAAAAMGDLEWLLDLAEKMSDDNYPDFDQMEFEYLLDCISTLEEKKDNLN